MYYDSLYGLGLVGCYCSGYVSSGNRLRSWYRRRSISAHVSYAFSAAGDRIGSGGFLLMRVDSKRLPAYARAQRPGVQRTPPQHARLGRLSSLFS
ncbi:hypothetical protein [Paenibacillus sophorae]|uniref:Uncharacterized protein n=1 Tax=Paenibacillus sophorae TaxID=1333845 RepID=A0ABX8H794_9BACL|nr:hypothetical protein [Paenibacillus sophorae]QWU14065.1 hypothetical protein KP014_19255 [Paenibacillus sophorae]